MWGSEIFSDPKLLKSKRDYQHYGASFEPQEFRFFQVRFSVPGKS